MIWGIKVDSVPAAELGISRTTKTDRWMSMTYVGKRTAVMMPVLHGWVGRSRVCGSRVLILSRQVNVNWRKRSASSLVRAFTSPMNMRKPGWKAWTLEVCWKL